MKPIEIDLYLPEATSFRMDAAAEAINRRTMPLGITFQSQSTLMNGALILASPGMKLVLSMRPRQNATQDLDIEHLTDSLICAPYVAQTRRAIEDHKSRLRITLRPDTPEGRSNIPARPNLLMMQIAHAATVALFEQTNPSAVCWLASQQALPVAEYARLADTIAPWPLFVSARRLAGTEDVRMEMADPTGLAGANLRVVCDDNPEQMANAYAAALNLVRGFLTNHDLPAIPTTYEADGATIHVDPHDNPVTRAAHPLPFQLGRKTEPMRQTRNKPVTGSAGALAALQSTLKTRSTPIFKSSRAVMSKAD